MRAVVHSKYGPPEVLSIQELEMPTPKDNDMLIKVYASTVNRTDLAILRAKPFLMRFFIGLFKPRIAITGTDFAGQIEAIGKNVKSFHIGDKVMGFGGFGLQSHAQYLTLPETKAIVLIPSNINYEQASACIEGAFYAQDAVKMLNPQAGQYALVNGGTGAIGSSAIQFFKYYGCNVTAVCGGKNKELVASLGADKIIDYKTEDFTKDKELYDIVFDAVGKSSFAKCKPLLKQHGIYTSSEGFLNIFLSLFSPILGGKKVMFRPPLNIKAGLSFITDLVEKGKFRPVIDRIYSMEKIAEAYTYVGSGEKIGNVVIRMEE